MPRRHLEVSFADGQINWPTACFVETQLAIHCYLCQIPNAYPEE